jgi:glyoxylase I family protein
MNPPFKLLGLDHVVLRVKDLERSMAFYCEILGCVIDEIEVDIGLYQLRAGRCLIDLVPVDGELGRKGGPAPTAEGHNMDHFALRIEPYPHWIGEYLEKNGVKVIEEATRHGAEGDGPAIYIEDPDGNVVELKGPSH